jgi:hypothetical protein
LEFPEASRGVDVDEGERAGELGFVDEAEVVVAGWEEGWVSLGCVGSRWGRGEGVRSAFLRLAVKRPISSDSSALEMNVFCLLGRTWLIESKARPSRPEEAASLVKDDETVVADSTACWNTVTPPTLTVSRYTLPAERLPSPYVMDQVWLSSRLEVVLSWIWYSFWPPCSRLGVSLLNTHRSDEPVSKLSISVCGGVPISTGARYSTSKSCGVAETSPVRY